MASAEDGERSRSWLSRILRPRDSATIEELLSLVPDASKGIAHLVVDNYLDWRANTVRWSAAYFGSTFGSAVLSDAKHKAKPERVNYTRPVTHPRMGMPDNCGSCP